MELSKIAGKAMEISPDMVLFANEAIETLEEGDYEIGSPVLEREVDAGRYGKKIIKIVPYETSPKDSSGKVMAWASPLKNEVGININAITGKNEEGVILHELIHLFDPKLTPKVWRKSRHWKNNVPALLQGNGTFDWYAKQPHEQDAYMADKAREIVKEYASAYDLSDKSELELVLSDLRNLAAKDEAEKVWKTDQKIWKKYLNTIYQRLMKIIPKQVAAKNWINLNCRFANSNAFKIDRMYAKLLESVRMLGNDFMPVSNGEMQNVKELINHGYLTYDKMTKTYTLTDLAKDHFKREKMKGLTIDQFGVEDKPSLPRKLKNV